MGDPFYYVHASSGHMAFRCEDMSEKTRMTKTITPIQVDIFLTKYGTLEKTFQLEDDELSDALLA
jgi:hypothetical protein